VASTNFRYLMFFFIPTQDRQGYAQDGHLMELCRYVVLKPIRAKLVTAPRLGLE